MYYCERVGKNGITYMEGFAEENTLKSAFLATVRNFGYLTEREKRSVDRYCISDDTVYEIRVDYPAWVKLVDDLDYDLQETGGKKWEAFNEKLDPVVKALMKKWRLIDGWGLYSLEHMVEYEMLKQLVKQIFY